MEFWQCAHCYKEHGTDEVPVLKSLQSKITLDVSYHSRNNSDKLCLVCCVVIPHVPFSPLVNNIPASKRSQSTNITNMLLLNIVIVQFLSVELQTGIVLTWFSLTIDTGGWDTGNTLRSSSYISFIESMCHRP
ncbi:oxidized low-density lipoprotein receptor 1-like [Platysternon megacephalum]|uniref:Oxidized low-density lipoprotein receptor 1-like n=1 Tax=Platysternon megacephalum TaxID=55544 RepID=A0A4D9EG61_9SAUR|nr:oxidized low-density lipoprotein receptor 1-like [Platysternon megacephalum]